MTERLVRKMKASELKKSSSVQMLSSFSLTFPTPPSSPYHATLPAVQCSCTSSLSIFLTMSFHTVGGVEGQSEEQVHPGDCKDQKNQGEAQRKKTKVVWACEVKGRKLLRQKSDGV